MQSQRPRQPPHFADETSEAQREAVACLHISLELMVAELGPQPEGAGTCLSRAPPPPCQPAPPCLSSWDSVEENFHKTDLIFK